MSQTDRGGFDQAEYDRRFHGDFMYDATLEDDDNGGGRSPLFVILTVLVLAAFGAVVWVAYQQGVKQGDRGAPITIAADKGPVRVAPEDPGGVTVPDQDKLIYDRIAGAEGSAPVEETLAPPPEQPQDLPLPPPVDAQAARAAATADATPAAPPQETPGAAEAGDAAIAAEAETAAPTQEQLAAEAAAKKQAAALTSQIDAIDPGAADAAAKTAASGAFVVQVGAFKADAEAASKWQELKRRNADVLGSLKPDILRVDLGGKGIWYRLRVGPFETRANAVAKCEVLKSRGVQCIVQGS
ncbi:MAG: SPOR domain-containing protein [Alphaproteobacteria bacterium]|nr:SPOR domain-containing protein [Alphaproteobacteria bacterium]